MAVNGKCDHCGWEFKAKDDFAGRTVKCKACGESLTLPPRESRAEPAPQETDSADVVCPHCGTEFEVDAEDLGSAADCDECGEEFILRRKGAREASGPEEKEEEKPPPLPPAEPEPEETKPKRRSGRKSSRSSKRAAAPPKKKSKIPLLVGGCLVIFLLLGGVAAVVGYLVIKSGGGGALATVVPGGTKARQKSVAELLRTYADEPSPKIRHGLAEGASASKPMTGFDEVVTVRRALLEEAAFDFEDVAVETVAGKTIAEVVTGKPGWGEQFRFQVSVPLVGDPELLHVFPPTNPFKAAPDLEAYKERLLDLHAGFISLSGRNEYLTAGMLVNKGLPPRSGSPLAELCGNFRKGRDALLRIETLQEEGRRINENLKGVLVLRVYLINILNNDPNYFYVKVGGLYGSPAALRQTASSYVPPGNATLYAVRSGTEVLVDNFGNSHTVPRYEEVSWAAASSARLDEIVRELRELQSEVDDPEYALARHRVQCYQNSRAAFYKDAVPDLLRRKGVEVWLPEGKIRGPGPRVQWIVATDIGKIAALDVDGHLHLLGAPGSGWSRIDCSSIHGSSKVPQKDRSFADAYPKWWSFASVGELFLVVNPYEALMVVDGSSGGVVGTIRFETETELNWMGRAWLTEEGRHLWVREENGITLYSLEGEKLAKRAELAAGEDRILPLGVVAGLPLALFSDKTDHEVRFWKDGEVHTAASMTVDGLNVWSAWLVGPSVYLQGSKVDGVDKAYRIDLLSNLSEALIAQWRIRPHGKHGFLFQNGPVFMLFPEADMSREKVVFVDGPDMLSSAWAGDKLATVDGAGNLIRYSAGGSHDVTNRTHWLLSAEEPLLELQAVVGERAWKDA
ncbi:MAG: zinc ribbon domain-containing protein [Planctomycetota bacterium]|jgi:DNA-directed RNA polymerase subunit RPC12/RpoP